MRLPWFFGSRPHSRRRASATQRRGRQQSPLLLYVRQLERRRVLDGAASSLVVGPTIEVGQESSVTSSITDVEPLVFDWTTPDADNADAQQTAAPYAGSAEAVGAFMASAESSEPSDGVQALGAEENNLPGVTAASSQTVAEGTALDLRGGPGQNALALVADLDLGDDYRLVVNWGDGFGFQPADLVHSTTEGGLRLVTFGGMHLYANDGNYTVKVRAADNHMGAYDDETLFNINPDSTDVGVAGVDFVEDEFQVAVLDAENNLPNVVAASDQVVTEGDLLDLSAENGADALGFVADMDVDDDHVAVVNWGDVPGFESANIVDSQVVDGILYLTLGGTHEYTNGGSSYTVRVRVADNNMGAYYDPSLFGINPDGTNVGTLGVDFVEDTLQVRVVNEDNHLPNVVAANPQEVNEGSPLDLSGEFGANALAFVGDEDVEDDHVAVVNWGDGTGFETANIVGSVVVDGILYRTLGGTHVYADGDTTYTVRVRVADSNMAAYYDPSKFGINPDGTDVGIAGVDFVEDTFLVVVSNVVPTLGVTPLTTTLDEGQALGIRALFSDPGFDNPLNTNPTVGPVIGDPLAESFRYYIDWGDGRDTVLSTPVPDTNGAPGVNSTGMFGRSHTYADDGVYTVRVRIADDNMTGNFAGGVDGVDYVQYSFDVTVNNVVPTLGVTPLTTTLDEGQALGIRALFSDPGFDNALNTSPTMGPVIGDPLAESFRYYIEWGDGRDTVLSTSAPDTNGGPGVDSTGTFGRSHTYADDGVYTVRVRIADDNMAGNFTGGVDGVDYVQYSFDVTVNNVVPTLGVTPTSTTINEGGTVSFAANFADPGFDNPLNTIPKVGPALGDQFAESFRYYIEWGDGRDTLPSTNVDDTNGSPGVLSTGAFNGNHTFADDGVYTVRVRIADDNMTGNFAAGALNVDYVEYSFSVTVNNVDPTLRNIAGLEVNEGQAFVLTADGLEATKNLGVLLEDPGFDNASNPNPATAQIPIPKQELFTGMSIDWGDGTGTNSLTMDNSLRTVGSPGVMTTAPLTHASHTYADDGVYTVSVTFKDDNGPFVTREIQITVKNVVPTLAIGSVTPTPVAIDESSDVTFVANFSDVGFDNPNNPNAPALPLIADPKTESFRYFINWGDGRDEVGTMDVPDINGAVGVLSTGTFNATHNYADDGVYTVRVRIADDNMPAFVDATKFGLNAEGGNNGVAGVDFSEQTFLVTVNNLNPQFIPNADGESFEGDDISSEGITTIRVSYQDIGYDNPNNRNAPVLPSISNPKYEIFTHLLDWGDGSVDAIHTYAVPGSYTVSVTVAGADLNGTFSFNNFPGSTSSVLTLVSGQTLNVGGETPYTYVINWGDGTIQTVTLDLFLPLSPLAGNGLTSVVTALRANGDANSNTVGAFEVQHRYLGPPNPLNPTADIGITVTVVDDNNATVSDIIFVPNPGIDVVNQRIDTTPQIPRLDFPTQPAIQALLEQTTGTIQGLQSSDLGSGGGETASTSKRYLELVAYAPDGSVIDRYELPEEELADLRALFARLPDGRYQIFLVRTDTNTRRLVMDVFVRRGRPIDQQDDTEGTRDRPPTNESAENAAAANEQQPALQPAANDAAVGNATTFSPDMPDMPPEEQFPVPSPQSPVPSYSSLRWGSSLAGLAIVAGGTRWSRNVDAALAQADDRAWQRLRRAGRLGRASAKHERTDGAAHRNREISTIDIVDRV